MLNRPPKKPGGEEVYDSNTATTIACETTSKQKNSCKKITNMLEKVKVPNIVRMENKTNQDTIKPLPWDGFMGNGSATTITCDTSSDHENIGKAIIDMKLMEKYQVTTLSGKEDGTNSTATITTTAFTLSCESEYDEYSCDVMMEPRTLSDHTYGFGRRR